VESSATASILKPSEVRRQQQMQAERHQQSDHAGEQARGLDPDTEHVEGSRRQGFPAAS